MLFITSTRKDLNKQSNLRWILLVCLLGFGALIIILFYRGKKTPALHSTLAPLFQVLGRSTRGADIAITKLLPIDMEDEKRYGNILAVYYQSDTTDKDYIYLNKIIKNISTFAKKPFTYRVFLVDYYDPNAFALPGGIICVTKGLLSTMKSEDEIVSVLGHEMGHIENGHCFEAVKFELAARKIHMNTLGELADFTLRFFLNHSFSKTQENEADEYGYQLLLLTSYDPAGFANAFKHLYTFQTDSMQRPERSHAELVRDYFMSHPPLPLRIQEFEEKAKVWASDHQGDKRYVGTRNFAERVPFSEKAYPQEWIIVK